MGEVIKVGMADFKICEFPDTLTTLGLGSCIGVALYDPQTKVTGLLHCMLPDSHAIKNNNNLAKFADSGIDEMLRQMMIRGANKQRIVAKIAGGAQMFSLNSANSILKVGDRNIAAVKERLKMHNIKIVSEDCGENYGRTVEIYSETGEYKIKSLGRKYKII